MTLPAWLLHNAAAAIEAASFIPTPPPAIPPGKFGPGSSLLWSWMLWGGIIVGGLCGLWMAYTFMHAKNTGERFRDQFSTLAGWIFGILMLLSIGSVLAALVNL
jgi:hypothetical protein